MAPYRWLWGGHFLLFFGITRCPLEIVFFFSRELILR